MLAATSGGIGPAKQWLAQVATDWKNASFSSRSVSFKGSGKSEFCPDCSKAPSD
jgi:hypothetical protein